MRFEDLASQFPILRQEVRGRPLRYLDSAATTQKPKVVLDALRAYYEAENANVHRGAHLLADRALVAYEGARERVRRFLNAPSSEEVVFVRGTTEAINLVAATLGRSQVGPGDEVLISALEHHSNLVPWQRLCAEVGAKLQFAPVDDAGQLDLDAFSARLNARTKLVAVTHVSNALGTVNPIRQLADLAHARNIPVVVDGAQAVAHLNVDVQALGCDFYAFSGHKAYGPMGIGAVWGKRAWWDRLEPWQTGGGMVSEVSFEETTFAPMPTRFEPGTPNVAGAVGLGAALTFLEELGRDRIVAHEQALLAEALERLPTVPGLRLVGTPAERAGLVSFVMDGIHAHDVGTALDRVGVAVRAGSHCAQPLMARLGVSGTVRASFAVHSDRADVEALHQGLLEARRFFG